MDHFNYMSEVLSLLLREFNPSAKKQSGPPACSEGLIPVRRAEWLKTMPFNQASAGSCPTFCKYLTGYILFPSGEGNGKVLL